MPTEEQKRIWKKEKEQMLKDKQKQGREKDDNSHCIPEALIAEKGN